MKKSKLKQQLEDFNSAISSLAARVKEIEGSTKQVNEPLTELPEKWLVATSENYLDLLTDWKKKVSNDCFDKHARNYNYISYRGEGLREIPNDYTEISFSDFERLVLKKGELEIGKWYNYNNWLLCYASLNSENVIIAYGFDNNRKWHGQDMFGRAPEDWIPATNKEVESALIEESKRRGFKEGVNHTITNGKDKVISVKKEYSLRFTYVDCENKLLFNNWSIFENGNWATVLEEPKQETFDWDKIGNLAKANDGDGDAILLITSKSKDDKTFTAVCVKGDDINYIGEYSLDYERCSFIPYKGSITLSNEPI